MPEIVKIKEGVKPFEYSHDNGITRLIYQPGQIYEIPDVSVAGLSRRGVIEILDRNEVDKFLSLDEQSKAALDAQSVGADLGGEGVQAGDADDGKDDGKDDGDDTDDAKAKKVKEASDAADAAEKAKQTAAGEKVTETLEANKAAEDKAKSAPSKPSTPAKPK